MMKILFNNFKAMDESIKQEIKDKVNKVVDSGWYILGEQVKNFEKKFATYLDVKHVVGVASGTEAIMLSLLAYGIGEGDEVLTTDVTAFPTVTAILMTGATPVLVDIDEDSGLIDPELLPEFITDRTKAIVPVHLYGQVVNMDAVLTIAEKYNLTVIEDCAQAVGARYRDKMAGSFGDSAAYSFYPTKNLGALGDGGAIGTNDDTVYDKLLMLRNLGEAKRFNHDIYGINSRLDEMQAAILTVKLKYIDLWNERRNEIADYYINNICNSAIMPLPKRGKDYYTNYHLFVFKSEYRNELQELLLQKNINLPIHYPIPCRKQKILEKYWRKGYEKKWRSDDFTSSILSLPIYPELCEEELEYIVNTINAVKL